MSLDAFEQRLLQHAVERANGNLSAAARLLGMTRPQLNYRIKKQGRAGARKGEGRMRPSRDQRKMPVAAADGKATDGNRTVAFFLVAVDGTRTRDPGVTGRYSNRLNYHSALTCSGFRRLRPEQHRTAFHWRPHGDSNPGYRRERAVS